ncbi:isocitrate lyase/phosphoenolpyruvate mutase family protein [Mumia zhuanghuii]|uniref:Isocitrate lyase/phosphoenolpyruvate mutase family protein n=2 Tax=Mumia TaxID=1546255 RepID=A0A5Q6S221_9ACTN|nr:MULTISPECIES: isocitrate lyase/phosphoenolpyruvate mutase family protein [Mumia]KAA1418031.1 isocitrate lyase/phosphoenolpyruvate mutase family protein [Mumia zhuanghuii]KAA1424414.1 isocitrate lyase/phosphoenolpyruvate mutase family protein [Mumia zhuanghuii]
MDSPDAGRDADRRERARRFATLHQQGCFLLPNAWDAGSARMLESAGFPAIATTSAGIAFSYGRPDHGFHTEHPDGGRLDRTRLLARTQEIAQAVDVPVSADLEDGYGAAPEVVAETVGLALAAGAAGGNIEDFTGRRDAPLYARELSVDRIRAARAAVDASGEPFVLVGRTDALITGGSIAEAIDRANAYLAAGADCAFVPGAADEATITTLVAELDGPLNVVMGLTGGALSLADLAALGVRRVTVGGSIARTVYAQLRRAATELHDLGTFSYADAQLSHDDLNALFGEGPAQGG